jgi:hypothetical protein
MPYLYALIKASEREPVLSHPHAVEGAEMGEVSWSCWEHPPI